MAFYSEIINAYDALFPYNEKQLAFTELCCGASLHNKSVLDMGCGTGALSIAIARRSAKVRSFDFNADMVRVAEEKRPQALDLQFIQGDMCLVDELFPTLDYDAVLCYGNTLVHLKSNKEVETVIKKVVDRLRNGGKFLLQIVNYDRIINDEIDNLPTIKTDDYSFVRNYVRRSDGKVDFATILNTPTATIENNVPLLMLTKEQLGVILEKYFSDIKYYGGFDQSPWSSSSFHLVVEATK